jgi:hypothetical protein
MKRRHGSCGAKQQALTGKLHVTNVTTTLAHHPKQFVGRTLPYFFDLLPLFSH